MPTYQFEAMDVSGTEVKDSVKASSEEEAQQKIRQMGYFVIKITPLTHHRDSENGRRQPRRPPPIRWPRDIWAYLCPQCQEVFLFDRVRLHRPFWALFRRPRVRCARCHYQFVEDPDGIAQPYQGADELPLEEEPRRHDYLAQIIVGIVMAVVTALILALLGLRG